MAWKNRAGARPGKPELHSPLHPLSSLPMSPLDHIRIVLVNTVYGGNVGSVCRAMMNMGLSQLVLVDPRPGMDMEDAAAMACHAGEILASRKVFATTAEAVA